MKRFIVVIIFFVNISSMGFSQPMIKAVKIGDKIDVTINKMFFTSYIFSENEKYPFFFPVNAPSGSGVTSMRNGVWPHHSSLFLGCDKLNGGDYWNKEMQRGRIVSVREAIVENNGPRVVIENDCMWKRPGAESPIQDFRKITITAPSKDQFQIDFEVRLEMLTDVTIEKTNHSFFSGRMDASLCVENGGTMIDADGAQGEKATFGKPSPWIDCFGKRGNKVEGMAIMQHPSNNWYPSPWFTRDYGFFSPTPMYFPADDKNTYLKKGELVHLKYRVIIHSGNTDTAKIAEAFAKYAVEQ